MSPYVSPVSIIFAVSLSTWLSTDSVGFNTLHDLTYPSIYATTHSQIPYKGPASTKQYSRMVRFAPSVAVHRSAWRLRVCRCAGQRGAGAKGLGSRARDLGFRVSGLIRTGQAVILLRAYGCRDPLKDQHDLGVCLAKARC